MTRIATFLLLLAGGLVALLFAVRLIAAAFNWDFSPFPYITPGGGHALLAWLLLLAMAVLAGLVWLVLRHDADALWLPSPAGDGGVLVPSGDLERPATSAAVRSHPDVVRAEVEFSKRGAELRGRVIVWARPLADPDAVRGAADAAVRRQVARLTGRDLGAARRARQGPQGHAAGEAPAVTPFARIVAVVAGIASLLLAGAALVRQAALAADSGVTWRGSAWWADLTARSSTGDHRRRGHRGRRSPSSSSSSPTARSRRRATPQVIEFAVEDGTARLSVPALRKALGRRFQAMLPGSQVSEIAVSQERGRLERARRGGRAGLRPAGRARAPCSRRSATTCAGWRPSSSCGSTSS